MFEILKENCFAILLDKILESSITKKRILHECGEFYKCYKLVKISNIQFEISVEKNLIMSFEKMGIQYKFHLKNYPFSAPIIYINNVLLKNYFTISNKHLSILKKWKNTECLCCSTCLTSGRWSANISFFQIINELERLFELKNNIYIIELIEIIICKYLIIDINIFSWIY